MITTSSQSKGENAEAGSTDRVDASQDSSAPGSSELDSAATLTGSEPKVSLTKEGFEKLLACFSSDRDQAAEIYLKKLDKLIRLFEWRQSRQPEEKAQETLDRVARRILEGVAITNLDGYIAAVANMILKEEWRIENREQTVAKALPTTTEALQLDDDESDLRFRCLDACLEELPLESRTLIEAYFSEDGRAKIDLRRELADKLGIGPNALRIRVHRILKVLEECVTRCCKQS